MSQLQQIKQDGTLTPVSAVEMKRALNSVMEGAINSCGTVTLSNGATTTTLYDNRLTPNCKIFFGAQTAHAAAVAASLWYDLTSITVSGTAYLKSITLNHSSSAQADLTFGYVIHI